MEQITAGMQEQIQEVLSDYGKIKERLTIRLCNSEKNMEKLAQVIHRDFLDLAIVPYIDLGHITGFPAAATIPQSMASGFELAEEQVVEDALANSPKLHPANVITPRSAMMKVLGLLYGPSSDAGLSIITTEEISYGACAILYPGILAEMAQEKGTDILLIPSSVHEFLAMADDSTMAKEELEALICDINRNEVAEGDVLSDNLYRFDRKTGEIRRA